MRPSFLLPCSLAVVVLASAAGCALDRHPISGGRARLDAGALDATTPGPRDSGRATDATATPLDAPPVDCAPACTDGRVCVAGVCTCPGGACCPACTGASSCVSGACVAADCGEVGEVCCATEPKCAPDAVCTASGSCAARPCGGSDEPCCESETCDPGYACIPAGLLEPSNHCEPCGGSGQPCCPGGPASACDYEDLGCDPIGEICRACGDRGQPCCPTGCGSGDVCPAWGYC